MLSILCINLKRRMDKRAAFLGAMYARNVPDNIIDFFDAYDGQDYSHTDEVISDIRAIFPDIKIQDNVGVGTSCFFYSYFQCLRYIAQLPDYSKVILVLDHTIFVRDWHEIVTLINNTHGAYIIQFQWRDLPERQPSWHESHPLWFYRHQEVLEDTAADGINCTMYTPKGAQRLLDRLATGNDTIGLMSAAYRNNIISQGEKETGVFVIKYPSNWINYFLNLSQWTGLPDSEREYFNRLHGCREDITTHFQADKYLKDIPLNEVGGKIGWGSGR